MRDSYHEELENINASLVEMANAVGSAMSTATTALLDADVALELRMRAACAPPVQR